MDVPLRFGYWFMDCCKLNSKLLNFLRHLTKVVTFTNSVGSKNTWNIGSNLYRLDFFINMSLIFFVSYSSCILLCKGFWRDSKNYCQNCNWVLNWNLVITYIFFGMKFVILVILYLYKKYSPVCVRLFPGYF